MARRGIATFSILLLMTGCGSGQQGSEKAGASDANSPVFGASQLERAAMDAGVVSDMSRVSPVGLYRKRHEAGRDSLCILPNDKGEYDFALEAAFGENTECRGHGTLRRSGDKLIMNFARSACIIVAGYQGDRVAIPGVLDVECDSLCTRRGTLEGVSFPRVSRQANVAKAARGKDGVMLCS